MRRFLLAMIVTVVLCLGAAPAIAEKRVALVIGNFTYKHTTSLHSPGNDATDIAEALKRLGFDVLGGKALLNLDRAGMGRAIRNFTKALRDAEIGLFYYSGHGIQVAGRNYVVPTDGQLEDESDVEFGMFALESIIKTMERGPKTNLVFLDACRDNPLGKGLTKSLGIAKGFVPESAGTGTLIAFATEPGKIALDGKGKYSPFTEGLLEHIEKPGIDVAPMLRLVRRDVRRLTKGKQTPWSNSSLEYDFNFADRPKPKPVIPGTASKPPLSKEAEAWAAIKDLSSPAVFEAFIKRFPNGFYAEFARARLNELKAARSKPDKEEPKVAVGVFPEKPKAAPERKSFEPEMVRIPSGSFKMGCVSGKDCRDNDKPVHRVTLKAFEIGKYEVTFDEWDACVAGGGCKSYKPEHEGWGRGKRPVINVSWEDAQAYVTWLSKVTDKQYRLPTEAEWEYATRAKSQTTYYFGYSSDDLCDHGNGRVTQRKIISGRSVVACSDGHDYSTAPVGSYSANAFGLHDVYGNASEWVEDCWHDNYESAPKDGSAWLNTNGGYCAMRILRGGSWYDRPQYLRSANRYGSSADFRFNYYGFRIARTL